ncbi:MAG: baseplate J/gp47 family protein [Anaerolineae bacterium]|nr:baseplate J/gp47 family protein [Anaerolineae bacterium]
MEQIVIKLEGTDDITSIRSRIDFALTPSLAGNGRVKRLLLVVPRKNKALQSLVNMKLLARSVQSRAVELAMVSDDPTVRDFAREAGVKAFGNLQLAKWSGWVTAETPVATPETTLPPVVPMPVEVENRAGKRTKRKKYRVIQGSGRINIWQQLGALILVVVLALALVVSVFALVPRATVTLIPVAKPLETNLVVKADPTVKSVDFKTLTFPARTAQVELALSGEIETTQTELAPVGRAEGTVTFINRTEQAQLIPVSTTLSTSAGQPLQFLTAYTVTIPPGVGATSTPTLVIAAEPGPDSNVRAGQVNSFEDPALGLRARVINEQAFSGGSMEPAKIVVQDDKARLEAYLRQQIQQEGLRQLQESLAEQEFISPETLQVIVLDIKYREFAGDFSDTFGGEMQAVVRGTVVGGYNANRLALAALEAQVPPGYELDTRGLHFGAGEVLDITDQTVTFRIIASGLAVPVIDKHEVAGDIVWLPIGDAQNLLNQQYDLATVPGVELQPDWFVEWLGRLPYLSYRIEVVIKEAVVLVADGD